MVLVSLTGYGQNVGKEFTAGDLQYKITSISPNVVQVLDYTGTGGHLDIPIAVRSIQNRFHSVNSIGNNAFVRILFAENQKQSKNTLYVQ